MSCRPTPTTLSPGSGPVDIYANQIQANLSNDDGGGIRFLMAGGPGGTDQMNVYNNTIVNNVSTHEGGGISLNDAPNVRVFNNTVMKNLTTATAVTSNGQPAPAGLSTSPNSDQLQATLPTGASTFSNPRLFNNIFWDNRAGTRAGLSVNGIGLPGDGTPVNHWDIGMFDAPGSLSPTSSVIQQDAAEHPFNTDPSNSAANPQVVSTYDVSVSFATWRQNPSFVDSTLVAVEAPADQLGDYHLSGCPASPACNLGAASSAGIAAPALDIDDEARPALGGFDAGSDEFGSAPPPPPPPVKTLYFSTSGNANPPGVLGSADDADVYTWNGTQYARNLDLSAAPYNLPSSANLDGFTRVDATHFYASFAADLTLPGAGTVRNEDVVYWNGTTWSLWFDGSIHGLGGPGQDVDAISVVGQTLYFSTLLDALPTGVVGPGDDSDVYSWNGTSMTRAWDASLNGIGAAANVDGLIWTDSTHLLLSFSTTTTTVPTLGTVQDEDVVSWSAGVWSVSFDGTANGLTDNNLDLDAISYEGSATAPPPPPPPGPPVLFLSTAGSANPPGAGGTADDADVYSWNKTSYARTLDLSAAPYSVPLSANVDGFSRVDANRFYVSFTANTALPGLGTVQDEDVVYWNGSAWSVFFNGTAHGLGQANQDVDAISVTGGTLYFSTATGAKPAGVSGTGDDADVYSWNGSTMARVWDASARGVPGAADVDGLDRVDATHLYLSFANTSTVLPQIGTTQDEDVVYVSGTTWSVYFNGTAHGLTTDNLDVDAFDVP